MPSKISRLVNLVARATLRNMFRRDTDFEQQCTRAERLDRVAGWFDYGFIRQDVTLPNRLSAQYIRTPLSLSNRIILYLHGGGFCVRSPYLHGRQLARLCRGTRATGFMPDYRLAPKHPYPAAFEDCLAAYQWLLQSGCRPQNMAVAGDSAGGTLTLALLLHLRDQGTPLPACGVMMSPSLDPTLSGDSARENAELDPMLSIEGIQTFSQAYMPGVALDDRRLKLIDADLSGLPPLLFQAGSIEILRDDSVRAAQKAQADGVLVTLQIWDGMPHVFQSIEILPEARQAVRDIHNFINSHLSGK